MICLFDKHHRFEPVVRDQPGLLRARAGQSAAPIGDPDRQGVEGVGAARRAGSAGHLGVDPIGFKLYPVHVLAGLLLLGVFRVGMGAFSNALAIASRKREWMFWAVQQSLLFPLLILSGMMLPLEAGRVGSKSLACSTR